MGTLFFSTYNVSGLSFGYVNYLLKSLIPVCSDSFSKTILELCKNVLVEDM